MLRQDTAQKKIGSCPSCHAGLRSVPGGRSRCRRSWLQGVTAAVVLIFAMASLFVISDKSVSAQQPTTLRCRFEQQTVAVEDNVTLFVELLDVADFYGYELTLKFNGARIQFEDADAGRAGINLQIGDFLSPDFVVLNEVNNSAGQARLALTQLSPSEAVSGTGELARATLTGVASGLVSFSFADVVLSDPAGVSIPVTTQGCSVEVTPGEGTATPPPPDGDAMITVEPNADATLIYTGTNGLPISIQVPAGAVTDTITLVYTEGTAPSTAPLSYQFAGVHFWLEAFRNNVKLEGYVFQIPIQIELNYTNADITGLAEESILLYYFEKTQGGWATDGIQILERIPSVNQLRVSVAHLTEFATFTLPVNTEATGSIGGIIFEDLNRNRVHDPDEPGVRALIKLYLLDSERAWSTLSKTDGTYLLQRLPNGEYFIEITPLVNTAYIFTTSATVNVEVSGGAGVSGVDFGLDMGSLWVIFLPTTARWSSASGVGSTGMSLYLPAIASNMEVRRD